MALHMTKTEVGAIIIVALIAISGVAYVGVYDKPKNYFGITFRMWMYGAFDNSTGPGVCCNKRASYDPENFTVAVGTHVTLDVLNSDNRTHGFAIPSFGLDTGPLKPNATAVLTFTATKVGNYTYTEPLADCGGGNCDAGQAFNGFFLVKPSTAVVSATLTHRSSSTSTTGAPSTATSTASSSSSTESSTPTALPASLGQKFIEIDAFEVANGATEYTAGNNFTATQLLSLIQEIHSAIGNFNIIGFLTVQCDGGVVHPNLMASQIYGTGYNWNGSLDSYVTAIQQAAGGQIIPNAAASILITDPAEDVCSEPASPASYYADAASLLTLSAISEGQRYIMLEGWDAWYANNSPSETTVQNLFQTLQSQGWKGFMPEDNYANTAATPSCAAQYSNAPDYGYAEYVRNGIFVVNTTSPYVFPNHNDICSIKSAEPYLNGIVVGIESQLQATNPAYNCGGVQYDYAIVAFARCLTQSQQETALTSLAANQQARGYTFIYPVVVGEYQVQYDAQQAGTLSLIQQLISEYN
jgi:hypothetical protein